MINDTNQTTYQSSHIVNYYAQLSQLQPAEATILNLLKGQLSSMKMLDIGVGGGRTTKYFARLVKQYIGIDYSAEMIAACQQRFSNDSSILLEVGDARDLSRFNDNYFDFILFSFNGIDYISHTERLQVFQEISRVGKTRGYFLFSTHNLQGIEREFNWRKRLNINPISTYVNLVMFGFLRFFNSSLTYQQLQNSPYAIIRDESHNFRLKTYYIRPIEQIKQLQTVFSDIKVYSWKTGQEIMNQQDLDSNIDMWLYYLCLIK
ncbi:class I SAM-dependent methyltransferase [Crocosphaera sp. UHCC 0190]|uniref:class I SAM-dependent methyltransferase n=1 Tax=Crocosphaera sp. UHCC 0190 TaxID=3110246 RepID=UPI002B216CD5|nr:class I SAM-dependent methyltransferase [Crocosphaera sp. UHCC 0190]MEA5508664.1 class I SAM-dependent methyltransferase [Crocosphaera sp. UHCC 0190]